MLVCAALTEAGRAGVLYAAVSFHGMVFTVSLNSDAAPCADPLLCVVFEQSLTAAHSAAR